MPIVGTPVTSAGTMTVAQCITFVKRVCKTDPGDDTIADALAWVGDKFIRETGLNRTSVLVNTVASTKTLNIAATATDFRPERFISAYLTADFNQIVKRSFETIRRNYEDTTITGKPQWICWDEHSSTTATLYPTPDAIYEIKVIYRTRMVDTSDTSAVVNIPAEYLREMLAFGVGPASEMNDPQGLYQNANWQLFINEVIPKIRDAVTIGGLELVADPDSPGIPEM